MMDGAPAHWRSRALSLGHGAFHGLQVSSRLHLIVGFVTIFYPWDHEQGGKVQSAISGLFGFKDTLLCLSLQVLVLGAFKKGSKPDRQDICSILKAGGATLLRFAEAIVPGADLAIMNLDTPRSDHKVCAVGDYTSVPF